MSQSVSMDGISSKRAMGDFWSENVAPMLRAGASAAVATGVQTAYADPNIKAAVQTQIQDSLQAQIGKFVMAHKVAIGVTALGAIAAIGFVVFHGRQKKGNPITDALTDAANSTADALGIE